MKALENRYKYKRFQSSSPITIRDRGVTTLAQSSPFRVYLPSLPTGLGALDKVKKILIASGPRASGIAEKKNVVVNGDLNVIIPGPSSTVQFGFGLTENDEKRLHDLVDKKLLSRISPQEEAELAALRAQQRLLSNNLKRNRMKPALNLRTDRVGLALAIERLRETLDSLNRK